MQKQKVIRWMKQNRFNYGSARKILEAARRNFNLTDADIFELKNVAQDIYETREDDTFIYMGTSSEYMREKIDDKHRHKSRNKVKKSTPRLSDEY